MEAAPSVQSFFGEGSPYLAHPLLTAERTSAEIDAIEAIVGSSAGRRGQRCDRATDREFTAAGCDTRPQAADTGGRGQSAQLVG